FSELKILIKEMSELQCFFNKFKNIKLLERILVFLILIVVIFNFFYSYAPAVQIREMMYDLSIPKFYISHFVIDKSSIEYYPFYYFFYFYYQMFYTICVSLHSEGLSFKLFNYFMGILNLLLLFNFSEKVFNKKVALISSAIYYLFPLTISNSGTANVEFGLVFYGLLSSWAILEWNSKNENRWLYLSAVMSGISFAIKLPGFSTIIAVGIFIIIVKKFFKKEKLLKIIPNLFIFFVVSFISFVPWVFRNYTISGVPTYPFGFFGLNGAPDCKYEVLYNNFKKREYSLKDYVKLNKNFHSGDIDQSGGPIIFTFVFIALIFFNRFCDKGKLIIIFGIINFFSLYFLLPIPLSRFEFRYYLFVYSIFAIISGFTIDKIEEISLWHRKIVNFFLIFGLVFPSLFMSIYFGAKRIPLFLGLEKKEEYIKKKIYHYDIAKFVNTNLGENDVILVVFFHPGQFYFRNKIVSMSFNLMMGENISKIVQKLKNDKITHLLFYLSGDFAHYHYCYRTFINLLEYSEQYFDKIYDKNGFRLYKLK
ncbi:MAG: glycosyltransferase family 39 protein, partial [Endomicrobiia bacterium]